MAGTVVRMNAGHAGERWGYLRIVRASAEHCHRDTRITSSLRGARFTDVRLPPGPAGSRRPKTRFTPVRPGTSSRDPRFCSVRSGATRCHVNITAVFVRRHRQETRFSVARVDTPCWKDGFGCVHIVTGRPAQVAAWRQRAERDGRPIRWKLTVSDARRVFRYDGIITPRTRR